MKDLSEKQFKAVAEHLRLHSIEVHEVNGDQDAVPTDARMHDQSATVPSLVVSPRGEWAISQTLQAINDLYPHQNMPISVKSGGHGYFNGATCSGIMLNLAQMTGYHLAGDVLTLEPGCVLGRIVYILNKHGKAVPHGDCYGVGAGGHFTTAGWDLLLTRRYGFGCQSVVGGRIVLWDGRIVNVDKDSHPELLYAMRGGAAAGVGVVSEIRLLVIDEPSQVTWCLTRLRETQLQTCVNNRAFQRASQLPVDITVGFRFFFVPEQYDPVCSFNIFSMLGRAETMQHLHRHLGSEVAALVDEPRRWNENKRLLDLRLLPASRMLTAKPGLLSEASSARLHDNPLLFWDKGDVQREMGSSFLETCSYWVKKDCDEMLPIIHERLQSIKEFPMRERVYCLVILGGGNSLSRPEECAMPLGHALSRFEVHWDHEDEANECRNFAASVSAVLQSQQDHSVGRTYRGDIWRQEQTHSKADRLHDIQGHFGRRKVKARPTKL